MRCSFAAAWIFAQKTAFRQCATGPHTVFGAQAGARSPHGHSCFCDTSRKYRRPVSVLRGRCLNWGAFAPLWACRAGPVHSAHPVCANCRARRAQHKMRAIPPAPVQIRARITLSSSHPEDATLSTVRGCRAPRTDTLADNQPPYRPASAHLQRFQRIPRQ